MPASTEALDLLTTITAGVSFEIPVIDLDQAIFELPGDESSALYEPIARIGIDTITDGEVTGPGAFDALMRGAKAHLTFEYEAGRITGAEYTKAYIAMVELAMTNATQFMLAREATFWEAQRSQITAITARAGLEQQKLQVAVTLFDANNAKANYARTVLSLASAEVEYDTVNYTLTNILPLQLAKLTAENTLLATQNTKMQEEALNVTTQRSQITAQTSLLGSQKSMTDAQVLNEPKRGVVLDREASKITAETTLIGTQNSKLLADKSFVEAQTDKISEEVNQIIAQTVLLGSQKLNTDAQTLNEPKKGSLLDEQVESARAQTLDTRTNGSTAVAGVIGKQKALYGQQIISYQRDSEVKAGKLFADAWITQKTIDEGLTAPTGFTNASLDQVLSKIKTELGMSGV